MCKLDLARPQRFQTLFRAAKKPDGLRPKRLERYGISPREQKRRFPEIVRSPR